jgi:hypothetical protein
MRPKATDLVTEAMITTNDIGHDAPRVPWIGPDLANQARMFGFVHCDTLESGAQSGAFVRIRILNVTKPRPNDVHFDKFRKHNHAPGAKVRQTVNQSAT